jgi:alkanesulfonate monooxygenase SsuD/methylene tetrahydromethanopterin reductase-like flavin-dependent oxidoreductase (luciferase family)
MRKQLVRRVAQFGHGWLPWLGLDTPLAPLAADIQVLKDAVQAAGRDPTRLDVAVRFRTMGRSLEQAFEEDVPIMLRAGITQAHVPLLSLVPTLDEAPRAIERIARIFESYRSIGVSSTISKT